MGRRIWKSPGPTLPAAPPTVDNVPEKISTARAVVQLDSLATHYPVGDPDRETPVEDKNPEPPAPACPTGSPQLSPISLATLKAPGDDISSLSSFSSVEEKNPDLEDREIRVNGRSTPKKPKIRSPSPRSEKRRQKRELPR